MIRSFVFFLRGMNRGWALCEEICDSSGISVGLDARHFSFGLTFDHFGVEGLSACYNELIARPVQKPGWAGLESPV